MPHYDPQFWEKFKTRLKSRWHQLSDEELESCRDDFDSLFLKVQASCDEPKEVVQNFIDNLWFEIYVRGAKHLHKGALLNRPCGTP